MFSFLKRLVAGGAKPPEQPQSALLTLAEKVVDLTNRVDAIEEEYGKVVDALRRKWSREGAANRRAVLAKLAEEEAASAETSGPGASGTVEHATPIDRKAVLRRRAAALRGGLPHRSSEGGE